MKNVLTPIQMSVVDKNTAYNGIPTLVLMENAGSQIANYIKENYPNYKKISIYAGSGGNGGDGLVIARHLLNYGYKIRLFILFDPRNIKHPDTQINYDAIEKIAQADKNLKIYKIRDSTQLKPDNSDIIIDAILGTGVRSKLREPISKAVDTINYSPAIVISVDIPTGLNPTDGSTPDKQVIPQTTLTLHKKKTGLIKAQKTYTGDVVVLDIGIPKISELYTGLGDLLKIHKPKPDSHKNQNGSILIIGSNKDYIGAVVFAATAALTQHIDLVYIVVPEKSAPIIKQYNPEFIVRSMPGDTLTDESYDMISDLIKKVDAILIGSGAGLDIKTGKLFNHIIKSVDKPIVVDADALKLVDIENTRNKKVIITPHAHEFMAFTDEKLPDMMDEKIELLQKLSDEYNLTILLKGVVDIITTQKDYKLNNTGNAGMTMGGTGDILAGLTCALVTKTDSLFDAASIAAFIIGYAANKAQKEHGDYYSIDDIFDNIKKIEGI